MISKKKLLEEIANLRTQIQAGKLTEEQMTAEVIALKAQIDASNAKMSLGGDLKEASAYDVKDYDSIFSQVCDNLLPSEYGWIFYRNILDIAFIWLNRYTKFDCPKGLDDDEIINAQLICILYGISAYNKTDNKSYFISFRDKKIIGYNATNAIGNYDFYSKTNPKDNWHVNKDYKYDKDLTNDDLVIFRWQVNNLGIFVWYLQDLLHYLMVKDILLLNANALGASLVMEVSDINNFKQEYKYFTNPRKLIKPIQRNKNGFVNKLLQVSPEIKAHGETLITVLRFLKEEMYSQWGISITSAKQQSLSSDANLSASVSETRAWEHDRRMINAMKKLGIDNFEINKPEVIYASNQNADKHGKGDTNTEQYKTERKSE